ncbi:MAG TPA: hypothetical protein ENK83_06570, partial [Aliiroseovarius sp.]|nr:hypothetical protein [Aliiroseovarius sp.]
LARRLAAEKGIDLAAIPGSGPRGRIVKADVEAAASAGARPRTASARADAPSASAPAGPSSESVLKMYAGRSFEEVPLDNMRKTIAARLTEAKKTIPHFYLRRDIRLDALLKFRSDNMTGEPVAPIAVESVEEIDPTTFHVHFSGVQGALQENPDVYNPSYFIGSPEHFGIDIYKTNNGVADGEIIASRIVDMDTIEFKYDRELSGEFRLWVGRSDSDGWITEDTGAGYGGTTLYDDGYLYSAVLPDSGLTLQTESLFEYVPQQHYDFFV